MAIQELLPAYKDYLWGGTILKDRYGKKTNQEPVAESWEVSTHPDGETRIKSGLYEGLTLSEYIHVKGRSVLGLRGLEFDDFPLLVKLIDAKKDLSIQVHPGESYAQKHEHSHGKDEMWFILEAKPDSRIIYGTRHSMNKDEFIKKIKDGHVLESLKSVAVKQGDVIFIKSGTIHAIGSGIVLCEVQQNSNVTYRIYDYNRKGADGNQRELNLDKAIDVVNLNPLTADFSPCGRLIQSEMGNKQLLVQCKYFTVQKISISGKMTLSISEESFAVLLLVGGNLTVSSNSKVHKLSMGDSVFIDANTYNIQIEGVATFLRIGV